MSMVNESVKLKPSLRWKIRRRIYQRKSLRHAVKGMRLVRELRGWGCESITCDHCYPYQEYHNCYVHDEIEKWNRKLLRLEQKYSDVSDEQALISIPEIKANMRTEATDNENR